jgi:hypothetical protein
MCINMSITNGSRKAGMTLKMFVFSRSRELLAGVLIALPGPGSLSGQVVIDISTHRTLAAALDSLQNQLGIPINYEDVPYQNPADLEDVSNPEERAKYPGFQLLVPRTGQACEWEYRPERRRRGRHRNAARELSRQRSARRLPGRESKRNDIRFGNQGTNRSWYGG